jgi:hypothetical protein
MKRFVYIFCGVWVLFLLSACAGAGTRFPIIFSYKGKVPSNFRTAPSQQKVVVFPLEDKREDRKLIARRIHLFGQVDTFESPITPVGENIFILLVASLRQRGWDARLASLRIKPKDITTDLVVTGTIQSVWAEAISHFGYTKIDAHFSLNVEIINPKTGVKITSKIADQNNTKVVFFHPELIRDILNELISSGLNRIDLTNSQAP